MKPFGCRFCRLVLAVVVALWSTPGVAWAVELEILGDMTSPHGGFGTYQNLLKWSEAFDASATWSASNAVVTIGATGSFQAPDGSTTSDKLDFTGITAGAVSQASGTTSTADPYTFSVWLKKDAAWASGSLVIRLEEASDATDGNEISISASTLSATAWERYSVSRTFASTFSAIKAIIKEGAAGDNPVVYVWGAQLEKSSKPNVYVRTDDEAVASISQGLAVGKNVHVTGDLEIHGDIIQHGTQTGVPGNLKTKGNIEWKSGTNFTMLFDHAITADRTVTFPDVGGTVAFLERNQTFSGLNTFNASSASPILIKPSSAPAANTKLLDVQATGAGSTLFSVDAEGDLLANALNTTSDFKVNTDRFTVAAASGNTTVAGTLGVTGAATLSSTVGVTGTLTANGDVTLGDANLDTVTVNAGPVKLVNAIAAADAMEFGSGVDLANLYRSAADTLKTDDAMLIGGTLGVTGATTLTGDLTANGNATLGSDALDTVTINAGPVNLPNATAAADALVLGGDANLYRSAVDTLKTDDAMVIASTLGVTGVTTLSSAVNVAGNVAVNTDKFTVTAATGNTTVAGTLAAGATSVAGDLSVRANDKVVMDSTDAGGTTNDTYLVHDNANDRIRLYVDGIEVARFKK